MKLEVIFFLLGCVAVILIAYTVYTSLELAVSGVKPADASASGTPNAATGSTASESSSNHTSGNPRFLMFYTTWCPWSKKGKVQWDAFKVELERFPVTFGGKSVTLEDIDGDVQRDMIRDYKISEYPTFKLVSAKGEVSMQGYPSPAKFRDFLTKNLGSEEPAKLVTRVS
jgi:thiol-disulfide isomerase/thioredoxin